MKKRTFLWIVAVLLLVSNSYAQQWDWVGDISCTNISQTNGMGLDSDENVIMFMVYQNDITIKNRTISAVGKKDLMLVKFNKDGDTLWVRSAGSSENDVPKDMEIDASDNIIITGGLGASALFQDKAANITTGTEDVFLTKYNADGSVAWAKIVGWGPDIDRGGGITIDNNGNIHMVGFFKDYIKFSATDSLVAKNALNNNFYAKFDANGNYLTSKKYLGTDNSTRLNAISTSNDNGLLISGFYGDSLFVANDTLKSTDAYDLILLKTDLNGNVQWIRTAGGNTSAENKGLNAVSDENGFVYMTGYFTGSPRFDSLAQGDRASSQLVTKGGEDMFVAKYSRNGDLQWKYGKGSTSNDEGQGLHVFENIVMFTGFFSGEITFGNDVLTSAGGNEAGFFIYDTDGNAIRGVAVHGKSEDRGLDIVYNNSGSTYLAGYYESDTIFFDDKFAKNGAVAKKNPFLAKYSIPFSASFTQNTEVNCYGGNDGSLTVTPYYGSGPYTYSWSHNAGLNDSVASNLSAGDYTVTVTDVNLKSVIRSATITQNPAIKITFDSTNLRCFQSNNGAIDISVTGGVVAGDYTYSWSGGTGIVPDQKNQSGLSAAKYFVTVTDDLLCTAKDSVQILQPKKITFNPAITHVYPNGADNGSIQLAVQGGASPYNYAWYKDAVLMPGEPSDYIENLAAASYKAVVTDDSSCVRDTTMYVLDAALLQTITYFDSVSCTGGSDGMAKIWVPNKKAGYAYSYQWADSATGTTLPITDTIIEDVAAGKYYITVTEDEIAGSNTDQVIDSVTVLQPKPLNTTLSQTALKCYSDGSGAASLTVNGGVPAYTYKWSTDGQGQSIQNLAAGKYKVTVTDANACIKLDSVIVTQPDSFAVTIKITTPISCFKDANGLLNTTVKGGNTGTKTYLWNDISNTKTSFLSNIAAGEYAVKVTDPKNCIARDTILLAQPDSMYLDAVLKKNAACYGGRGTLKVQVVGGTSPYDYIWQSPTDSVRSDTSSQKTTLFPTLEAKVYAKDAHGCKSKTVTFTPVEPASILTISEVISQHQDIECYGDNNGGFTVQSSGGWGEYSYSIDRENYQDSPIFQNLSAVPPATYYNVSVKDAGGCEVFINSEIKISTFDTLVIDSTGWDALGFRVWTNGGGNGDYEISFDGVSWWPLLGNSLLQNTELVPENPAAMYIRDESDCQAVTDQHDLAGDRIYTRVYPVPTNGNLFIEMENIHQRYITLEIINSVGSVVYATILDNQAGQLQHQADVSALPAGIYHLRLNGRVTHQRIIKQ